MQKLPSINLLVTFDAAARHLSFKAAADEIFVTPSAVGHQIRVLEKELQMALFVRLNRKIELTPEGKSYHLKIKEALKTLRSATTEIMDKRQQESLLVHSTPYLTSLLLVPNIKSFKADYPTLKVSIESKIERASLSSTQRQIAIRHDKDPESNLCYEEITKVHIAPVCAPSYLKDQLKGHQLCRIQLSTDQLSWPKWQSDWYALPNVNETLECDGMQAVIDMAEQGLGIAMGYFPALKAKVKAGKLVLPYPNQMSELAPLYLAYDEEQKHDPIVQDFIAWFKAIVDQLDT